MEWGTSIPYVYSFSFRERVEGTDRFDLVVHCPLKEGDHGFGRLKWNVRFVVARSVDRDFSPSFTAPYPVTYKEFESGKGTYSFFKNTQFFLCPQTLQSLPQAPQISLLLTPYSRNITQRKISDKGSSIPYLIESPLIMIGYAKYCHLVLDNGIEGKLFVALGLAKG